MSKPAVFFDRDATLIKDVPYNGDPALVKLMPYAAESLRMLKKHGFELFIVSNQAGVAHGLITKEQVAAVNAEMLRQLEEPFFSAIYYCYDGPDDPEPTCRKPSPQMVFQASDEHDLNLAASFFVGDKPADMECGRNAGCRTVLVLAGEDLPYQQPAKALADYVANDLMEAAKWICRQTILVKASSFMSCL